MFVKEAQCAPLLLFNPKKLVINNFFALSHRANKQNLELQLLTKSKQKKKNQ